MNFSENISKDDIAQLPKAVYSGQIEVIRNVSDLSIWLPILVKEKIIGFDTETKPSFKKGEKNTISLLQLATADLALLVKLKEVGLPDELIAFFEDPTILKVGAAIHDDIKSLQFYHKFTQKSFVDLQSIVSNWGIQDKSVRKLAGIILGVRVSKSQQLSNWEATELSPAQISYAAIDAWVCQRMYLKLLSTPLVKKEVVNE